MKIYDCVHLDGDISLLKEHVSKLNHLVDVFVILEESLPSQNETLYHKHQSMFSKYEAKIMYLASFEKHLDDSSLKREYLKALEGCTDRDVILFSSLSLPVEARDVSRGALCLERHPDQFIQLKKGSVSRPSSNYAVKAATYGFLKSCLAEGHDSEIKYTTHIIDQTGIFFPV